MAKVKKKQKIHLIVRKAERTEPKSDYLKYLKVARYWMRRTYGLSLQDLEMLLFLRTERMFTRSTLNEYRNIFGFEVKMFNRLLREGWITKWRKEKYGEVALYEVSPRGKRVLNAFYMKLEGKEDYSTSPKRNPVFKKSTQTYTDKTMAMQMEEINRINRETRLKPSNYDWSNPNS